MEEQRAFGNYLRSERELRQIPLGEIAAATKIPLHSLESLEHGEWDELPAEVFIKGFVRSYAKYIGMSPEEVCEEFSQIVVQPVEEEQPVQSVGEGAVPFGAGKRRFSIALIVIIVLIITTITLSLLWRGGAGAGARAQLQEPSADSLLMRHG